VAAVRRAFYTLFRRGKTFYAQDTETRQQTSLRMKDKAEAAVLLHAKNEAFRQPVLNLQIARTYLSASDPEISKRMWSDVMAEMAKTKTGATLHRHHSAMKEVAFDLIRKMPILETQAVHFTRVLETGTVSTNVFLRRLQNFALGMNWLPWPILPTSPVFRFTPIAMLGQNAQKPMATQNVSRRKPWGTRAKRSIEPIPARPG
jgi:hypothetical protein